MTFERQTLNGYKEEYVLADTIQLQAKQQENGLYKAYIIGLKRVTVKGEFNTAEDALKAAKQAIVNLVKR